MFMVFFYDAVYDIYTGSSITIGAVGDITDSSFSKNEKYKNHSYVICFVGCCVLCFEYTLFQALVVRIFSYNDGFLFIFGGRYRRRDYVFFPL